MAVTDAAELLDPEFVTRLERLDIVSRKIFAGKLRGERKSKRKGQSVEFADYRNYVAGDDLRFLDWNIYARLDSLFLKLFLEEEDLHLGVLLDCSASMDWGEPNKALYAKKVAAALAYIGLVNYHRVSLFGYADTLAHEMRGLRGRRLTGRMIRFLADMLIEGTSDLTTAARRFALAHATRGVLVVLSDFLDKGGFEQGLRYLLGRNLDLYVIHILSRDEQEPELLGDLRLVDVEDADEAEVTISRPLISRYKANLQAFCVALKDFCSRRGIHYLFTSTDVPFDQLVMNYLRRRGLLK
jgi:uncharacterized protein (DUF58 family)